MSGEEPGEVTWKAPQSPERNREPYLSSAVICERVIQDAANQAFSLINLYDRVTFIPTDMIPTLSKDTPLILPLTIHLSFRTMGQYSNKHMIRMVAIGPSGREYHIGNAEVEFKVGDNAANVTAPFAIAAEALGYYFFDIFLDETFLTRVPLQIADGSASFAAGEHKGLPVVQED